jgi:hypothetical protein
MLARIPRVPFSLDPLIAEAKQRARRRRWLSLLAVVVAVAAVGSALGLHSGSGSGLAAVERRPVIHIETETPPSTVYLDLVVEQPQERTKSRHPDPGRSGRLRAALDESLSARQRGGRSNEPLRPRRDRRSRSTQGWEGRARGAGNLQRASHLLAPRAANGTALVAPRPSVAAGGGSGRHRCSELPAPPSSLPRRGRTTRTHASWRPTRSPTTRPTSSAADRAIPATAGGGWLQALTSARRIPSPTPVASREPEQDSSDPVRTFLP